MTSDPITDLCAVLRGERDVPVGEAGARLAALARRHRVDRLLPDRSVQASRVDALLDELDGFPLYIKGLDPKADRETRLALTLASQSHLVDKTKSYFGLAGVAYNIPLTPVTKKDKSKDKKEDEDVKTPSITISDDNFTEDKSILITEEL